MTRFGRVLLWFGLLVAAGCGSAWNQSAPVTTQKGEPPSAGLPRSEQAQIPVELEGEISPDPACLRVPVATLEQARELVRRLGNGDANERGDAERRLGAMGRRARQALAEGSTAPAPHVREVCARLLSAAADHEMRARIRIFVADTDQKYTHDLPGVRVYLKQTGTSAEAIALAAAVFRYPENRELFATIEKGGGGGALQTRRHVMYGDMSPPRQVGPGGIGPPEPILEHLAALFVAETAVSSDHIPNGGPQSWIDGWQFGYATHHRHALAGFGPHPNAYKAVIAKWLATRKTVRELHYLTLGHFWFELHNPEDMFAPMVRVVTTPGMDARNKCSAMKLLVQKYPKERVEPALLRALKDDALIDLVRLPRPGGGEDQCPCHVRDVARAFLLHLANESIESYGYEYNPIYGPNRFADTHFIRNGGYAIRTEEARTLADVRFGWWLLKCNLRDAP